MNKGYQVMRRYVTGRSLHLWNTAYQILFSMQAHAYELADHQLRES